MEMKIVTTDNIHELHELCTMFGVTTTTDTMMKTLAENDREIVCIAYIDGVPVGFISGLIVISACYAEVRAEVEALYVKSEYQRRGIGEALVKYLEKLFIAQGISHFHIATHSDNLSAQSLCKKLGYSKTGEILLDKTI